MDNYKVVISKSAGKEISKLPVNEILKIKSTIMDLEENPRPFGVKNQKVLMSCIE